MTFFSDGIAWAQKMRHTHMTRDIYIGYERATAAPIKGTVASSETNSTQDGVNQIGQSFKIIVRTRDIHLKDLVRGTQIWVQTGREKTKGQLYEIAMRGRNLYEYNDPDHLDIILYCILKRDGCANPLADSKV
jgi:hypothetical protein